MHIYVVLSRGLPIGTALTFEAAQVVALEHTKLSKMTWYQIEDSSFIAQGDNSMSICKTTMPKELVDVLSACPMQNDLPYEEGLSRWLAAMVQWYSYKLRPLLVPPTEVLSPFLDASLIRRRPKATGRPEYTDDD